MCVITMSESTSAPLTENTDTEMGSRFPPTLMPVIPLVTWEREWPSIPHFKNVVPGTGTRERFRSCSVKLHSKCCSSFLDLSFRKQR
jgi:hypothetical protein